MSKINTADLVSQFLASGRTITVCPTRKVGPTRATINHPMSNAGKQERKLYEETAAL